MDTPYPPGSIAIGIPGEVAAHAGVFSLQWTVRDATGAVVAVGSAPWNAPMSTGVLPPGPGYSVTLVGQSDAGVTCQGSAGPVTVVATQVVDVIVPLECGLPPSPCNPCAVDDASLGYCGTWQSVAAIPSVVPVGDGTWISVAATGADVSALHYEWAVSDPAVGHTAISPTGAAPMTSVAQFVCDAPGTATITVTVFDGPVPDGGSCTSPNSVVSIPARCNGGDGGVDADVMDSSAGDASDASTTSDGSANDSGASSDAAVDDAQ